MGASFEDLPGGAIAVRFGDAHEEYGDPWTGSCVLVPDGAGGARAILLSGRPGFRNLREGIRRLRRDYGIRVPEWERIAGGRVRPVRWRRSMSNAKYEGKIVAEYREQGTGPVKARATIEYFDMDKSNVEALERGLFGGLLGLQQGAQG